LAFGPAHDFSRPEPPKARPKPGLLGQAGAGTSLDSNASSINSNASNASNRMPAAPARDATRLELSVCFFDLFFLFVYYTNDYFRYTQHVETAMAAASTAATHQQ
jgi:hypothetical protein